MINYKRITLLCGHYGSGKTNIAVNMAFDIKKTADKVTIADLDIVNPYFRTKDSSEQFKEQGIRLICSEYANSNVDIPALPADIYSITADTSHKVVIDVGGDDRGALALGRISSDIMKENNYEMLMVINCYRPLTRDAKSTIEVMKEIEIAGKIPFTGIVNNSNLGQDTTAKDVLKSCEYADEVSKMSGLPVVCTAVSENVYKSLEGKIQDLLPLRLQNKNF